MENHFPEIPDLFWGLFRSGNRMIYIEALLRINEEYQYSNYYLSKEICVQTLTDYFAKQKVMLEQEETEDDFDLLEPLSTRILNWLLRTGWLKRVEDYSAMTVNIVIPDYAAVFIEAFARLAGEDEDETQVHIQNIYGILFAFKNDPRSNISLLKTALINTRRLNKTLQDMLHNMDKFFGSLLEQKSYGDLLQEHLEGYVEEIVQKKYHILKTSDNFYLYKTDIKRWLLEMRQDSLWLEEVCRRNRQLRGVEVQAEALVDQLELIERGFDDIEHRIINMDREHTRYIRATVTRMNYLLNKEDNMKGLVIQLLNHLADTEEPKEQERELERIGKRMNLSYMMVISNKSLYKKRRFKQNFVESLDTEEETTELSGDEVLQLNKIHSRYSRKQVESFILEQMKDGRLEVGRDTISSEEDFERLVLAYDSAARKDCPFQVREQEAEMVDNGRYRYPRLVFEAKNRIK